MPQLRKKNLSKLLLQHIGPLNIKTEYELSHRKIKNVNDEYDLGVGFDDTFKAIIFCLL